METRRPSKTLADYLVIAVSPVLIMVLVHSLCFFLADVFYLGAAIGSVRWVLFWFVLAVVLIARIGIEKGDEYAMAYGIGLAIATGLYLLRVQPNVILDALLLAIIWFTAHKLTSNCTLIDENADASGQGLLQTIKGLPRIFRKSRAPVAETQTPPPIPPAPPIPPVIGALPKTVKPHVPGIWLIYYSLAALPIFGLGQILLPAGDMAARHRGFVYLFLYLAAALGLLVTTSFLGLRRYLRQRYLAMPGNVALGWVQFGVAGAAVVLCLALLVPRPGASNAWSVLHYQIGYQLHRASKFALRFNPPGTGPGRVGTQQPPTSQPPTTLPTAAQPPQTPQVPNPNQNPNGDGSNSGGEKSGGDGNQGTGQGQGGGSGQPEQPPPSPPPLPQSHQGRDSDQKSNSNSGGEKSGGNGNGTGQGQGSNSGDGNQGAGQGQGSSGQQQPQTHQEPNPHQNPNDNNSKQDTPRGGGSSSQPEQPPQPTAPPDVAIYNWVRILFWFAVIAALIWVIYRYRTAILMALRSMWAAIRKFIADLLALFRPRPKDVAQPSRIAATPPFETFENPFLTGADVTWSPQKLIIYTYEALQSWAIDRAIDPTGAPAATRGSPETPREFCRNLGEEMPEASDALEHLAFLYGHVVYGSSLPVQYHPEQLRQLWDIMSNPRPARPNPQELVAA
jgi:hypothetical protein